MIDAFRDAGWKENQGAGISDFLYRAASDFAPHPALRRLATAAAQVKMRHQQLEGGKDDPSLQMTKNWQKRSTGSTPRTRHRP
jgi:hypothetical protein